MENMWQFEKSEMDVKSPKEILKEQSELLPSLTGDMVYASVIEDKSVELPTEMMVADFVFSLFIKSKFLPNYRFRVLTVSHRIPIYPVKLRIDDDIKKELEIKGVDFSVLKDEEEFNAILKKVLSSKRISTVISSIIKLSK